MNLSPFNFKHLLAFLIVVIAIGSCKQPETVIVDRDPDTAAARDTTTQEDTTKRDASFRQLVIGEYQPITTLDPLQISSATEMRAVQLLYEGLVRYDREGDITSAIAREWSVENENKEYTFRLRTDVYFHDNDRFGSGTGRKLMAEDIKFALERSAQSGVSPKAAQLFMNISGFEPYFQEQRNLYNPDYRQLDEVSGIQVPNDSTVVITLNNADPNFLQKLATPLAVIYPKEAVGNNNNSFEPIGSGPFTFSRQQNDSTHIFSKFDNYYNSPNISLNRVDIISSADGQTLWDNMQSGDIHYLPELGPILSQQLLNENGNLTSSYSSRYQRIPSESEITFTLHHNPNSNFPGNIVTGIGQIAQTDTSALFENMRLGIKDTSFNTSDSDTPSLENRTINIASLTDHPYSQQLMDNLSMFLDQHNAELSISNSRIPHQGIDLFITERQPFIPELQWASHPSILQFSVQSITITRSEIKNLTKVPYPWWIDVRNIQLPPIENLN